MNLRHLSWIAAAGSVAALVLMIPRPVAGQAKGKAPSPKMSAPKGFPTPRTADGKVDFTGVYHAPGYGPGDPRGKTGEGFAHNIARDIGNEAVPMLPWAQKAFEQRVADESRYDPEGFCLPMGTPRVNPYPWKIMQDDKLLVILYEGNVHHYRQVFMDGRKHDPTVKETYWGDSIGTWEGNDTLVIDTVGLGFGDGRTNRAWLDADGHSRTNKLHVTERFTRPELGRVSVEVTIDDPGAYTRPWKVVQNSQLAPNWEITENICNENQDEFGNNQDVLHLVGEHKK